LTRCRKVGRGSRITTAAKTPARLPSGAGGISRLKFRNGAADNEDDAVRPNAGEQMKIESNQHRIDKATRFAGKPTDQPHGDGPEDVATSTGSRTAPRHTAGVFELRADILMAQRAYAAQTRATRVSDEVVRELISIAERNRTGPAYSR
jgi:hypothetical protein